MAETEKMTRGEILLSKTARRALALLSKSDYPQAEMIWADGRLTEAGLLSWSPPTSDPARWTAQAIAQNPDLMDQSIPYLLEKDSQPQEAETFEELILSLIPTEGGL